MNREPLSERSASSSVEAFHSLAERSHEEGFEGATMNSSGQVTLTLAEQTDAEMEFDQATPGSADAEAAAAKIRAAEAKARAASRRATRTLCRATAPARAPRRQSVGVRRRACSGGRRRPGVRRTRASSSSGSDPGGGEHAEPEVGPPGHGLVPFVRRSTRLQTESFTRIGTPRHISDVLGDWLIEIGGAR
jgi:hypothetical protein